MPFTEYGENELLTSIFGDNNIVYFALSSTTAAKNGTGFSELAYTGYTRIPFLASPSHFIITPSATGASTVTLNRDIVFAAPSSAGSFISVGIYDAPTGGNLLAYHNYASAHTMDIGCNPVIAKGAVMVSMGVAGSIGGGAPPPSGVFPETEAELITWIDENFGVTTIKYTDIRSGNGNDTTGTGTSGNPWATVQKLVDELNANELGIIRGTLAEGLRIEEQVLLPAGGSSQSARKWLAISPDHMTLFDGSQSFNETWTQDSGNVYWATYNKRRPYQKSSAYFTGCTNQNSTTCVHESAFMTHGIVHNDAMLKRIDSGTKPTLAVGECWFDTGGSVAQTDMEQPDRVYINIGQNPSGESFRIFRNDRYILDYCDDGAGVTKMGNTSQYSGESAYPANGTAIYRKNGRDNWGFLNLHFRYFAGIRKIGHPAAVRGSGQYWQHCSFAHCGVGFGIYGDDYTLKDILIDYNGGNGAWMWRANNGTIDVIRVTNNNQWNQPGSFLVAGIKIEECNIDSGTTVVTRAYVDNNDCPGWWYDVDNGKSNPGLSFDVSRSFFGRNIKGNVFNERISRKMRLADSVLWGGRATTEGASGNKIGPNLRTQATDQNIMERVVLCYADGKGSLYKVTDTRGNHNADTWNYVSVIANMQGTGIDIGEVEFQGGDDETGGNPRDWDTSSFNNMLFAKDVGASHEYFEKRDHLSGGSTSTSKTNSLATFEGWTGSAGNGHVIVSDPALVNPNYTDMTRAHEFISPYEAWAPQNYEWIPDTYNWTAPTAP